MTNVDPFGNDSRPAVTWKDKNPGDSVTLIVDEPAKLVQQTDFESGEPAFWPANADGTRNPKMAAVVEAHTPAGEEVSLWAPVPSSLQAAIRDAQKAAGAQVAKGGTLVVTLVERKPNAKNPRLNPQNIFAATYRTPDAFAEPPAAPAQQAVTAPPAPPAAPATTDKVTALKAELAKLRKLGLSDAQIPSVNAELTADAIAALGAVA